MGQTAIVARVVNLGEDLVILAVDAWGRRWSSPAGLAAGIRAAELVELSARGRIRIERGGGPLRVVLVEASSVDDPQLDAMLASIPREREPRTPTLIVGSQRRGNVVRNYLDRLSASGAIAVETSASGPERVRIADRVRHTEAKARVDAVVRATDETDAPDTHVTGIVSALGLGKHLYPGWAGRRRRTRLAELARRSWAARAVTDHMPRHPATRTDQPDSPNDLRNAIILSSLDRNGM